MSSLDTTKISTVSGTIPPVVSSTSPMQAHALRFGPGTDLVPALNNIVGQLFEKSSSSCCILTAVGSLSQVSLRMASATRLKDEEPVTIVKDIHERVEIVSLVGTFSNEGGKHLHMSVSLRDGSVLGGHVIGGKVFTTLELVLGTLPGVSFTRELDPDTGYDELVVRSTSSAPEVRESDI